MTETFDHTSGVTRTLSNPVGYLTEPRGGDPTDIALEFIEENLDLFGLEAGDIDEIEITDVVRSSSTGATHVYLRQKHQGLPVYNAQLQIHINREGRILSLTNAFIPNLRPSLKPLFAAISAVQAVLSAARDLNFAVDLSPRILEEPHGFQRLTPLIADQLSKEPIQAELMWLPVGRDLKLVWRFQVHTPDDQHVYDMTVDAEPGLPAEDGSRVYTKFDWVSQDSYHVFPIPAESPNHVSGREIVVDPADPIASPLGWHNTGIAQYTNTRGNNVHAFEEGAPDNNPSCGAQRNCDFSLDLSQGPRDYVDATVANLFYWNNLVHDIQYQYGFDEESGNFQYNNFGRGGFGFDPVQARAQDRSGINNASFLTEPDSKPPLMRMFVFTGTNPDRAGSLDSGIVVHEYGHGITNRQVGGPHNVGCLANRQQPGEGWSDFIALVYTAKVGDEGTDARGMGTYVLGQDPDGPGVRTQRYSTDPSVNTHTYESINGMAVPHGVGEVWAQALWEMYWSLVDKHGFDPDLYNVLAGRGNQRALLYVNEGLKYTACSPTFTDARDGIIQAAVDNFGGEDVCTLWEGFADFGLGIDAISGGPGSTSPTNGFSVPESCWPSPPYSTSGVIDWNVTPTVGYTRQDGSGSVRVQHGGNTLSVMGNRWRRTDKTFTITPSTILEFQFRSGSQGEIHGIGLDEDDFYRNDRRIFRIYGTESWSDGFNWPDAYTGSKTFETFRIPIGQYYTGSGFRLVIVNDKDRQPYNNSSQFSHIRISEGQTTPPVTVPPVVGKLRNEAESDIFGADLVVGTVTTQSSSVRKDEVLSQDPAGGTTVEPGSSVNLVVSSGPLQVQVPHVVGLTQGAAETAIGEAELVVGTVTMQASSVPNGEVLSQDPVGGASVAPGSAVNLTVSSGSNQVAVPLVVGLSRSAAEAAILAAELVVGTVTTQASSVPEGNVISQNPLGSTPVAAGTPINLVVSSGIAPSGVLDWNATPTVGYTRQDRSGSVSVEDGGTTLVLIGNRWRRTQKTFTITPSTILEFEFQSDSQGEIHGIGFDEDDFYRNDRRVFRIFGTENWTKGINWSQTYSGSGEFETFSIPVGEYYTGSRFRLVIVNDKDRRPPNNTGRFRNVRIYEK